jgi:hypothetical protein
MSVLPWKLGEMFFYMSLYFSLSQATTIMRLWNRYLAFGVVESSDKKNNCTTGENEV